MLRFILGLVTIGIVVFCLVYFLWTPETEKPAVSAAATVRPTSSAAPAATAKPKAKAKAKSKRGEDDDDDDNENNAEESDEDAIQEQRLEQRMSR